MSGPGIGHPGHKITKQHLANSRGVFGTTAGLQKVNNEDRIDCRTQGDTIRCFIADGHWGDAAAARLHERWLTIDFPADRNTAVALLEELQSDLYRQFGGPDMDPNKDFTPEAACLMAELHGDELRIVSYGDCRLIVVHDQAVHFAAETKDTWLGAFSHLGLRQRLSVAAGLVYLVWQVRVGDAVLLFTDGVDECKYGQMTIPNDKLAVLVSEDIGASFDRIMQQVFKYGAEDNASLSILRGG